MLLANVKASKYQEEARFYTKKCIDMTGPENSFWEELKEEDRSDATPEHKLYSKIPKLRKEVKKLPMEFLLKIEIL